MIDQEYVSFEMVWSARLVSISFQLNWLNTGQVHIELRCDDPLPVTSTGYRSLFVSSEELTDISSITAFVLAWLDAEARTKEWRDLVEASRQLKLF